MHRYLLCGIGLMVFAFVSYSFGLELDRYLEHYTEEDGLGSNVVSSICLADSGVKWFAGVRAAGWSSDSVVSRFDERSWQTFNHCGVVAMAVDTTGQLWVCSLAGPGIYYLKEGRFQPFRISGYGGFSYGMAITFGVSREMWMGGMGGSMTICRYRRELDQWSAWGEEVGYPTMFAVDAEQRVWFVDAYGDGVYRISENGEAWDRIDDNLRLPSGIKYRQIYASHTGRVWVQASRARPFYSDDYDNWVKFDESPLKPFAGDQLWIQCVAEDGIWLNVYSSRYRRSAFYHDYSDWRFIRVGATVSTIEVDERSRDVWFGTTNGAYVMRGGPEAWPPVWIELEALVNPGGARPTLSLLGSAEFQMDLQLDLYVAVELPDGRLLFGPDWTPAMTPLVPNLEVPIGLNIKDLPLVELDLAGVPEGSYRWFAACTHAGTTGFASNIASCEWEFIR